MTVSTRAVSGPDLPCGASRAELLEQYDSSGPAPRGPHQQHCVFCQAFLHEQALAVPFLQLLATQTAGMPAGLPDRVLRRLHVSSGRPTTAVLQVSSGAEGHIAVSAATVRALVRTACGEVAGAEVQRVDVVVTEPPRVGVLLLLERASTLPQTARHVQGRAAAALSRIAGVQAVVDVTVIGVDRL